MYMQGKKEPTKKVTIVISKRIYDRYERIADISKRNTGPEIAYAVEKYIEILDSKK